MANDNKNMKPFMFMSRAYVNFDELVRNMALSWKEGRQVLFSGKVRDYFKTVDKETATNAQNAEKDFHANAKEGDLIYWKWLYKSSAINHMYWKGKDYGTLQEFTAQMKKSIIEQNSELTLLLNTLVGEKLLSVYVSKASSSATLLENVKYVEYFYNKQGSRFDKKKLNALLYIILSASKSFNYDLKSYTDIKDLAVCLQEYADESKSKIKNKSQTLFLNDYNLNPFFEGWLLNLGFIKEVTLWNERFQVGKRSKADDDDDVIEEQEIEQVNEASNVDFMQDINEFEVQFFKLLTEFPDAVDNRKQFSGLLKDYFPKNPMQVSLVTALYKMNIVQEIRTADEMNSAFAYRFTKRLSEERGIRKELAIWVVSLWCVCYGERMLGLPCELSISRR